MSNPLQICIGETYSRIGLLRSYGNLQSYWTTTKLWKPKVVLDYHEAMKTYGRIGLPRTDGNLQSYWTTTKLLKLIVVLDYYEANETYSRIVSYKGERADITAAEVLREVDSCGRVVLYKVCNMDEYEVSSPPVSSVVLNLPHPFRV